MKKVKKALAILLVLVVLLSLVACGGNKAENSSDLSGTSASATQSGSENKKQHYGKKVNWKCDIPISEIREFAEERNGGKYFITNNNELYAFSTGKPFSNDKYEKKISDIEFSHFFIGFSIVSGKILYGVSMDKTYYNIYDNSITENEYMSSSSNRKICGYELSTLIPIISVDGRLRRYCRVDEDNNFFEYKKEPVSNSWEESKSNLIIPQGETVISAIILYNGMAYESILKTDKAYYKYGISNAEEVNKYADVESEYNWVLHKELTAEYDNIKYIKDNYIIYKDEPDCLYKSY